MQLSLTDVVTLSFTQTGDGTGIEFQVLETSPGGKITQRSPVGEVNTDVARQIARTITKFADAVDEMKTFYDMVDGGSE